MTSCWHVYRLTSEGDVHHLGFYVDRDDADKAFEYYSEVAYPHSYVDIEEA